MFKFSMNGTPVYSNEEFESHIKADNSPIMFVHSDTNHGGCYQCQKVLYGPQKEASAHHCKGCDVAVYCSTECQKKDWTFHKQSCRKVYDFKKGEIVGIERGLPYQLEFPNLGHYKFQAFSHDVLGVAWEQHYNTTGPCELSVLLPLIPTTAFQKNNMEEMRFVLLRVNNVHCILHHTYALNQMTTDTSGPLMMCNSKIKYKNGK